MYSLFWKFFVSFWLALVLFAGLSLWGTSSYLEHVRAEEAPNHPRQRLHQYVNEGRTIAAQHGRTGLRLWLTELDRREAIPFYLIDEHGTDILDRNIPARILMFWQTLEHPATQDTTRHEIRQSQRLLIHVGKHHYRLMPDYQSVTLGRLLHRPRVFAVPLFVAMAVSALVCLLLARYLTAPISQLRRATHQLAAGNFTQRVAPMLGNRKDEIVALATDFDVMAVQLQQLIASHQQLLRDASHELRSPLARLQVALGLARQRAGTGPQEELDRIERESEHLNELIAQLLTLTRLETGHIELPQESIDLPELLQSIVSDASFEASTTQRQIRITHTVPALIEGNPQLLHSAIENVVRNALRHTPVDTAVEVALQHDSAHPGWVTIHIRDYGPGIPATMLARVFEPFVRVGEARDRQSGGYGLGLAIAKRAVVLHSGEISAHNEQPHGLKVSIRLPVAAD